MPVSYQLTPRAHLLLVIAALEFAKEQRTGSVATRGRIGLALSSARRDLAKLKRNGERSRKSKKGWG